MEQDNKAKQTGLSAWSWKRLRQFRARIRSRYDHVSRRGGWRFLGFIYIPAAAEHHIPKAKRARRSAFLSELERLAALRVPWACAILGYHALLLREDGSRDIERALSLCQEPAQAGDAYTQYTHSGAGPCAAVVFTSAGNRSIAGHGSTDAHPTPRLAAGRLAKIVHYAS